jgi:hypothetical protein
MNGAHADTAETTNRVASPVCRSMAFCSEERGGPSCRRAEAPTSSGADDDFASTTGRLDKALGGQSRARSGSLGTAGFAGASSARLGWVAWLFTHIAFLTSFRTTGGVETSDRDDGAAAGEPPSTGGEVPVTCGALTAGRGHSHPTTMGDRDGSDGPLGRHPNRSSE